ncbi:MAG: hypothetical protein HY675_26115 [Chloroflexi bacterium]|nr:hypothetical protein [Chloroflexota bacterium]
MCSLIFERSILPDVVLLKRQLQTYSKEDRIDLVGIDSDNNVVVVEIKDRTVDESIIPQVLRYAVWVETHPDAVKSIWLEQKDKLAEIRFDWDREVTLKILVVAPSFKPSVQRLVNRITYPVMLLEFKKFCDGEREYIFLDEAIPEKEAPYKAIDAVRLYDLDFYKKNYSPDSAKEFWRLCERVETYVKDRGWNLSRADNKGYVAFKYGFFIVFGVQFVSSKSFALFFKIPQHVAERFSERATEMLRYEEAWNQAVYKVSDGGVDLQALEPLFSAAYDHIVRKK